MGAGVVEAPGSFRKFVTKLMHFRHTSAKIQPKNPNLICYEFLAVRGNIRWGLPPHLGYALGGI